MKTILSDTFSVQDFLSTESRPFAASALLACLTLVSFATFVPKALASPAVGFDLSQARALGNACTEGQNVTFKAAENQLSLVFQGRLLSLPQGATRADVASCRAAIPMTVPRGYYISQLKTEARAHIIKSSAAMLSLMVTSSFFGVAALEHEVSYPAGQSVNDEVVISRTWEFSRASEAAAELCGPLRAGEGLLRLGLTGSATLTSTSQQAGITLSGDARGLDLWLSLAPCG